MIAILASGDGSNFEALCQNFPTQISALICNVEGAYVLERAKKYSIPTYLIPHKNFNTRSEHEQEMIRVLQNLHNIKLIVLAGYMRILSPYFFQSYANKNLINLHPAHLDQYKGAEAYKYAVEHQYPRWGLSIHCVTEQLDSGALLNSVEFSIYPYETEAELKNRAKNIEHQLLINTVRNLIHAK